MLLQKTSNKVTNMNWSTKRSNPLSEQEPQQKAASRGPGIKQSAFGITFSMHRNWLEQSQQREAAAQQTKLAN
jgi:hypothetical protein